MTRGILIAGNASPLLEALGVEASKRVERFAFTRVPGRLNRQEEQPLPDKGIPLAWNPGSPISARTLILSAENRLEHIDEAILVCSPPAVRQSASELAARDIEVLVNDHIKGWFFLVKELASVFKSRKTGTLALVFSEISGTPKGEKADLLGASALASFRTFAQGLLVSSFDEPYITLGFSSSEEGAPFASFIFRILDESGRKHSGKWYKFGKFGFFGR